MMTTHTAPTCVNVRHHSHCYSASDRGTEYCVCLCVCLSLSLCVYLYVCEHIFGNTLPIIDDFLCMLPKAVARSSSDVILAHKPRQLNVAAQLMEAQPTCSLGLGYKRHIGIPVAGQWTHTHGTTSGAGVWAY